MGNQIILQQELQKKLLRILICLKTYCLLRGIKSCGPPRKKAIWEFSETRGYVLDFAGLRKFLAEDLVSNGAEIMVGTAVSGLIENNGIYEGVKYHGVFGGGEARAKIIIDASGHHEFGNSF